MNNICPICGGKLNINEDGYASCTSCEYSCRTTIIKDDFYMLQTATNCMICGDSMPDGKDRICDKCRAAIMKMRDTVEDQKVKFCHNCKYYMEDLRGWKYGGVCSKFGACRQDCNDYEED